MKIYILLFYFFLLFIFSPIKAQNLEQIGTGKILKVTGGISANQVFYVASGQNNRRNPYDYFLSGNINFDLYGWSVPLSFSVSNQQVSYQQPFNQYGLHPTYKWVKTHIGWNSMNFSTYTLAGHVYNGFGVELTPKDWLSVSAMYGRLQKGIAYDTTESNNQPAFRRMGTGFKVGLKHKKDQLELIAFRAWDNPNSIGLVPDSAQLKAQDNLVLSIHAVKTLFEKAVLDVEIASTAITEDIKAQRSDSLEKKTIYSYLGGIFRPRTSTGYYNAMKGSLSYPFKIMTIGATYERIEPGYRTLGAYFFNNDLENITANIATKFFKSKITLAANAGLQRNDLYNQKASQMRRIVGAANVSVSVSKKMNANFSYSNFQSFTNMRSVFDKINQTTPFQNLDTLNFRQISQNMNLSINYAISRSKERSQMLLVSLSYQNSADEQGGKRRDSGSQFYNFNVSHSYSINKSKTSISSSFALNRNETLGQSSLTLGPNLSISKPFMKGKLKTTLSSSFNNAYQAGKLSSTIFNMRLNSGYVFKKKHNFSVSTVLLRRDAVSKSISNNASTEFTGTLIYGYTF